MRARFEPQREEITREMRKCTNTFVLIVLHGSRMTGKDTSTRRAERAARIEGVRNMHKIFGW